LKVITGGTRLRRILSFTSIVFLFWANAHVSHAQAIPTASRSGSIQLGAGYSFANPDYGQRKIQGYTIYGSWDFTRHWGIEGNIHRIDVITPTDIAEDSYLLGPRYVFRFSRFSRFKPYAKGQLGFGRFKTDFDKDSLKPNSAYTYKIYSLGGGLDIRATPHINVRAVDFEYQGWPGFSSSGLSPYVFTFGAAYTFH
jgi:hypothetical protein